MAANKSGSGRGRETVPVPTKRETTDASRQLRAGHSSGGRVMAEAAASKNKPKRK